MARDHWEMPACHHCYAESEPEGSDGAMLPADWCRVIDEVAQLGGRMVQFIGGEPTVYRKLPQCGPNCGPACNPSCWPHGTGPCGPKGGCVPNYGTCGPDDEDD
jgi:hypothetical protein